MAENQKGAQKGAKARVLSAVTIGERSYKPNDVDVFDEATLKAHVGVLDADPAAVKYAEGLATGEEEA